MSTIPNPAPLGLVKHLPQGGFIAIIWVSVAVSLFFVLARAVIRWNKVEGLAGEDYWIYFAWLILTINAILQTLQTPHMYYLALASAGRLPVDETLMYHGNLYVRYEFASIGLFWTVLWSVKASFLAVFWKLFRRLPLYRRWWVGVAGFAFLAYVGCWISSILNCPPASQYFNFGHCLKPIDVRGAVISISYSTAVDILTDIMIMAMPLSLLCKIQITHKQKMGLAAVFGIAIIIILIATIRAIEITTKSHTDAALLSLWSIIESTVAIIVGCLPPFKSLFASTFASRSTGPPRRTRNIPLNTPDETYKVRARGRASECWDSDSQTRIVRRDEEVGEEGDIRVERVFVTLPRKDGEKEQGGGALAEWTLLAT